VTSTVTGQARGTRTSSETRLDRDTRGKYCHRPGAVLADTPRRRLARPHATSTVTGRAQHLRSRRHTPRHLLGRPDTASTVTGQARGTRHQRSPGRAQHGLVLCFFKPIFFRPNGRAPGVGGRRRPIGKYCHRKYSTIFSLFLQPKQRGESRERQSERTNPSSAISLPPPRLEKKKKWRTEFLAKFQKDGLV
jgi:hypothetical protein